MSVIAAVIGFAAIGILYSTAIDGQRARLTVTAQSQARLMEAVARHNRAFSGDFPGGPEEATIRQLVDAHEHYSGFGETGEFTLARRQGDQIVFILRHRHSDLDLPRPVDFESALAEPMRRALSGQSGTVIGLDYRGVTVLAAHEPVDILNFGVVAKNDLSEIRAPFVTAILIVLAIAAVAVATGTFLFFRISSPILHQIVESEEKFRSAFDNPGIGAAISNLEGRFLRVNDAFCGMIGYSAAELLTKTLYDITHPDDVSPSLDVRDRLAAMEFGQFEMEKRYLHKDGGVVFIRVTGTRMRDGDGRHVSNFAQIEDVTEQKRKADELTEYRNLLQTVIETTTDSIYVKDRGGKYLLVNPAAQEMMSKSEGEIVGKTDQELFGRAQAVIVTLLDRQVMREGATRTAEETGVSGGQRTYLSTKSPYRDADGKISGIIGISTDITGRKQTQDKLEASEERYRTIYESSPDGISFTRLDGSFEDCNHAYSDLLGYSLEEQRKLRFQDITPRKWWDMEERILERLIETGEPVEFEKEYIHRDGHVFPVSIQAWLIRDEDGKPHRLLGRTQDITERKRVEGALIEAKEQAESANRTKTEFLANMSHELRTPLNAVIGFSEVMTRQLFGPMENGKYLQYASDINSSGKHLLDIITDILDISRVETGNIVLDEKVVDVAAVVKSCQRLIMDRAREAKLHFRVDLPVHLPGLYADELRLKQVIINLLSNAIKFTREGGSVTFSVEADENQGFTLTVADCGIGIDERELDLVLTPFYRSSNPDSRRREGAGLGLPLAKSLTELHGGTLEITSQAGIGTTVSVRFGKDRIRHPDQDESRESASSSAAGPAPGPGA